MRQPKGLDNLSGREYTLCIFMPTLRLTLLCILASSACTSKTPGHVSEPEPGAESESAAAWSPDLAVFPNETGENSPPEDSAADTGVLPSTSFETCFAEISRDGSGPDYTQFEPLLGSHCKGTNHQEIRDIERVVFLGDSVTAGTPPSSETQFYRNLLADSLAAEFGLESPNWFWQSVNPFDGQSYVQDSGDFATCAKWGARTDDLMRDNDQVIDCLPEDKRHLNTLVVVTIGGNDLASLTRGFMEGHSVETLWSQTHESLALVREAVEWITTPGRFPNGVSVIFTNLYEFTDATGDTSSCPAADLAGMGGGVSDPALEEMVIWSMEEFMSIAVDTGTDMLFLLESFCGHGYHYDDPSSRCYRGPDAELWFDLTCIHPNPTGHTQIADMFMSVVLE